MDIESLAKILHEAGREAVLKGCVVRKDLSPPKGFIEWEEMDEPGREGRRIQARYLLQRYNISDPALTLDFGYGEANGLAQRLLTSYLKGQDKFNITSLKDFEQVGFLILACSGYLSQESYGSYHGYYTLSRKFWQKLTEPLLPKENFKLFTVSTVPPPYDEASSFKARPAEEKPPEIAGKTGLTIPQREEIIEKWKKRLTAIRNMHRQDPKQEKPRHPCHAEFVKAANEFDKLVTSLEGKLSLIPRGNGYDCQLNSGEILFWDDPTYNEPAIMNISIQYNGEEIIKINRNLINEGKYGKWKCTIVTIPTKGPITQTETPISEELASALENLLMTRHKELGIE